MGADLTDVLGTDRAVHTHDEARRVIKVALERYGGPCSQAYADVLSAYVAATDFGRANLFLEMAYRALGVASPGPNLPAGHQHLADFAGDAIRDVAAVRQDERLSTLERASQRSQG